MVVVVVATASYAAHANVKTARPRARAGLVKAALANARRMKDRGRGGFQSVRGLSISM